jgi:hypothetical protein
LEKPTRGKPVREGIFIISELRDNDIYSSQIIIKSKKLISRMCPTIFLENSSKLSLNSCPENSIVQPSNFIPS